jgi:putative flippase GtrA
VPIHHRVLAWLPAPVRSPLIRRREFVKFALVGGFCYLITVAINYGLRLTILTNKPVTALTIGVFAAAVVSYLLNRSWSFRTRGGRRRHHEVFLFFLFSALALIVTDIPLLLAHYVFDLRYPEVTHAAEEISDFVSGMILGTVAGTAFRLWTFRRWVFPQAPAATADLQREPVGSG